MSNVGNVNIGHAIQAYTAAQKSFSQTNANTTKITDNFQTLLQQNLNNATSASKMAQINIVMQARQQQQAMIQDHYTSGFISQVSQAAINNVRNKIEKQEEASRKLITGDGSALELLTASAEANQQVSALSKR